MNIYIRIMLVVPTIFLIYSCVGGTPENGQFILYTCCSSPNEVRHIYDLIHQKCIPVDSPESGNHESFQNSSELESGLVIPSKIIENSSEDLEFRLMEQLPACKRKIEIILQTGNNKSHSPGGSEIRTHFTTNGDLHHNEQTHSPDNFCINDIGASNIAVLLCDIRCEIYSGDKSPCLRKCCPLGQRLDFTSIDTSSSLVNNYEENHIEGASLKCSDWHISNGNSSKWRWKPQFYYSRRDKLTVQENSEISPFFIVDSPKEWCSRGQLNIQSSNPLATEPVLFRISTDGRVIKKKHRLDWKESTPHFCIDAMGDQPANTVLIECVEVPDHKKHKSLSHTAHRIFEKSLTVLQLISAFFLLATAVVKFSQYNPEHIQKTAFTRHVFFLFLEYTLLSTGAIYSLAGGKPGPICYGIGLAWHFVTLKAACWLFVLNFDFCWEFHSILTGKMTLYSKLRTRRAIYWVFAVMCPNIIVATGLFLNSRYGYDIESEILIPQYGQEEGFCGLERKYAIWAYLYGPFGFLLAADVILLSFAYLYLKKIEKLAVPMPLPDGPIKIGFRAAQKIDHVFRILVVVGINYLYEVTYWAAGDLSTKHWYIWIPFEIIHALHGIEIFFAAVWIRPVLDNFRERYPRLMSCCGGIDNKISAEADSVDSTFSLSPDDEKLHSLDDIPHHSEKELR